MAKGFDTLPDWAKGTIAVIGVATLVYAGWLVKKGIDAARMETVGYGSKNPVASNKTSKGRAENRRVDVKVK